MKGNRPEAADMSQYLSSPILLSGFGGSSCTGEGGQFGIAGGRGGTSGAIMMWLSVPSLFEQKKKVRLKSKESVV